MGKATSLSRVWLRAVIFGDQTQVCLQWGISATVYLSCAGALTFSFGSGSVLPQDDGRYMYRITWIWICTWIGVNEGELKILVCGSQRICSLLGLKEGQFLHRSCRASEGGCRRADVFIYISVWPCPHPWLCLHSRRVLLALWYRYRPCSLYKPLSFTRVSNTTCHRSHHQFCFLFDFPPSFQGHKRNSFSEELTNQHYTENCSSQQLGWSLRNRISKFPEQYRGSFQTPEGNFMFPWTDLILLHHFPPGFWTPGFSAPLHQLVPSDGCWHIMCNSFFTLEVSTSGG